MKAHSLQSECRWDQRDAVGNVGVVYEFEIKIPPIRQADCTDREFNALAEECLDDLAGELRRRYTWIGKIHRAGRSGGWLAVEDKKGLATREKLKTMIGIVSKHKRRFAQELIRRYPA
jgi:hypothetical protein